MHRSKIADLILDKLIAETRRLEHTGHDSLDRVVGIAQVTCLLTTVDY